MNHCFTKLVKYYMYFVRFVDVDGLLHQRHTIDGYDADVRASGYERVTSVCLLI